MLPLNTIEEEMKQVCEDYMKGEKKMKQSIWIYVVRFPRPIQRIIQYICGKFGHIIGDTGYSGCNFIHCYCKKCNFYFKVPLIEMPNQYYLKDIFEEEINE